MIRALLFLLVLSATLAAEEDREVLSRVRAAIEAGDAGRARTEAERALRHDPESDLLRLAHAEAVRAFARDVQRREGHVAALAVLERHLTHPLLAVAYGETCAWAGSEERGIEHLRASPLPLPLRIGPELDLLAVLGRLDEAARRAQEAHWPEWVEWAREQAGLRARLEERMRTGAWVAALAAATILGAVLVLFRMAGPPATSGSRS
jgi:hypothetical protein